ncbi:DUF6230 family protein [Kutzneria viridogrisea]|uniref:Cholesterol esterase n=1 Tax=Kutzneria viridogrisea TaxID=47990 RepID=A0ABR6BGZ6_9PSEU|nr:hypothetical protein [Kutzneria viridogrisea]
MTEGEEPEQERGRTRWTRFAATLAVGGVGAGVLLVGLSQGALAASFTVSGSSFKVSADHLQGDGFVQFGSLAASTDAPHPVARNGFRKATLDNFCQSVFLPKLPILGDLTMRITAAGPGGMQASDLVVDVAQVDGDFTLTNPQIGVDASQVSGGPAGVVGRPGDFGMQADKVSIDKVRQTAWGTSAQTIAFKGMSLRIVPGQQECGG